MGVPITFLDKYNPAHFEIICLLSHGSVGPERPDLYKRIVIRNLRPELPDEIDLVEYFGRMGIPVDVEFIQPETPPEEMISAHSRCETTGPAMVDGRKIARKYSNRRNYI